MAPSRRIPALYMRCRAPIQSSRSGLTGFLTNTATSAPRSWRVSAISCMAKGLAEVRAPIQSRSTPASRAASTWARVATSMAVRMPVSSFTFTSHGKPSGPTPSKPPGRVRGFQMPARKILMPYSCRARAVVSTCSSVSALQGPAIIIDCGLSKPGKSGRRSVIIVRSEELVVCLSDWEVAVGPPSTTPKLGVRS